MSKKKTETFIVLILWSDDPYQQVGGKYNTLSEAEAAAEQATIDDHIPHMVVKSVAEFEVSIAAKRRS